MEAKTIGFDEDNGVYPAKILPHVVKRIAHIAGVGKGVELDPKPFFKMNTALTTSPQFFAYAYRPKMTKAEAMERMRAKYGV